MPVPTFPHAVGLRRHSTTDVICGLCDTLPRKKSSHSFPHAVGLRRRSRVDVIFGLSDESVPTQTSAVASAVSPNSTDGRTIVMNTATFILRMVANGLFETKELFVRHGFCVGGTSLDAGLFLEVKGGPLSTTEFEGLQQAFFELIENDWAISTVEISYDEAVERFKNQRCEYSHSMLTQKSEQAAYECFELDQYICFKVGEHVMLPTTKLAALAEVGIVFEMRNMPNQSGVHLRIVGTNQASLSECTLRGMSNGYTWAKATGVSCAGDINRRIMENPEGLVRLEELRFDEEVMACAKTAVRNHSELKVVLISGPSASGKTTFASKLAVALRSLGKIPTVLSTDDYYRDTGDADYPRINGKLNHETVEALRLPLLQEHLKLLMQGETVEVPVFDMKIGKPKPKGKMVCLQGNGVLLMEGIFALDPRMLPEDQISANDKTRYGPFSIYISPIPYFSIDEQTFLSNRTLRLIRRIARDYRHRGRGAAASINRLDVVNEGEVSAVLPYLSKADYLFNSVMAHEIPMLRVYVGPLLTQVPPTDPAYFYAKVIIGILNQFSSIMDSFLPSASLLCEFVSTSVFEEAPLVISSEQRPVKGLSVHADIVTSPAPVDSRMPIAVRSLLAPTSTRQIVHFEVDRRVKLAVAAGESEAVIANIKRFKDDLIAVKLNGALTYLDRMVFTSTELEDDADHVVSSPTSAGGPGRIDTASGPGTDYSNAEVVIEPVVVSGDGAAPTIRATLTFLLHVAVRRLWPSRHVVANHGFGGEETDMQHSAYFLRVHDSQGACVPLSQEEVSELEKEMSTLLTTNVLIRTKTVSLGAAIEYFNKAGMKFSVSLLQSRNESLVDLVQCRGEAALYFQPLCPHAGQIPPTCYAIHPYDGGIALAFSIDESDGLSSKETPAPVCPQMSEARMGIHRFSDEVRAAAGVGCVGDLNEAIFRGRTREIMQVSEALEQKTISELVTRIRESSTIKVLLFAGASGSGKSVLTEKLKVQLKAKGLTVRDLILDNYYKNNGASDYPLDKHGNCDFEQVDALCLEDLQRDVGLLLEGKTVEGPSFDIGAGRRREGTTVRIEGIPLENGVLLIEGIFALQERILPPALSPNQKLRVVVHPTSILNVDELRFVSHQVLRMLRRIVRDYHCRTRDARDILSRWRSVADGEIRNVIPFIDSADVLLNASNLYEIGSLKSTALPLLNHVSPSYPVEYAQAAQLKALLEWYYIVPNPDTITKE